MRSLIALAVLLLMFVSAGCEVLRFAPSEQMKQNAWLHHRTTQLAAETAKSQQASQRLCQLTSLSALQSKAFVADYGLPRHLPASDTAEQILSQANQQLAERAIKIAGARPNGWDIADGLFELGIGAMGLLGGAWGLRLAGIMKKARQKSRALREIIEYNELFKKDNPDYAKAFKTAHKMQSAETRLIVNEIKSGK